MLYNISVKKTFLITIGKGPKANMYGRSSRRSPFTPTRKVYKPLTDKQTFCHFYIICYVSWVLWRQPIKINVQAIKDLVNALPRYRLKVKANLPVYLCTICIWPLKTTGPIFIDTTNQFARKNIPEKRKNAQAPLKAL